MIIGGKGLKDLQFTSYCKEGFAEWHKTKIELKLKQDVFEHNKSYNLCTYFVSLHDDSEPCEVKEATKRVEGVLDAVCKKADMLKIVADCACLDPEKRINSSNY